MPTTPGSAFVPLRIEMPSLQFQKRQLRPSPSYTSRLDLYTSAITPMDVPYPMVSKLLQPIPLVGRIIANANLQRAKRMQPSFWVT
jgi:hypothetical protein